MLAFLRRSGPAGQCPHLREMPTLASLRRLPAELTVLPGWRQRRRALSLWALAGVVMLLRPLWPLRLLPGGGVGALLLWAVVESLRCCWWPRRWR